MSKGRIIELQKQVKIARKALELIACGSAMGAMRAREALDEMWKLEPKQPLQHLVGNERPARR